MPFCCCSWMVWQHSVRSRETQLRPTTTVNLERWSSRHRKEEVQVYIASLETVPRRKMFWNSFSARVVIVSLSFSLLIHYCLSSSPFLKLLQVRESLRSHCHVHRHGYGIPLRRITQRYRMSRWLWSQWKMRQSRERVCVRMQWRVSSIPWSLALSSSRAAILASKHSRIARAK
jgi:hypothetical protein